MLKMAYELRISDWSSDLCSACLKGVPWWRDGQSRSGFKRKGLCHGLLLWGRPRKLHGPATDDSFSSRGWRPQLCGFALRVVGHSSQCGSRRSEEHTSELQSLMRISYAVFCLKKKKMNQKTSTLKSPIHTKPYTYIYTQSYTSSPLQQMQSQYT